MINRILWIGFLFLGLAFTLQAQTPESRKEVLTDEELLTQVQRPDISLFLGFRPSGQWFGERTHRHFAHQSRSGHHRWLRLWRYGDRCGG